MTTAQPQERQTKKILVTVKHRGRITWTLATAVKVGNKYRVANSTINMLAADVPHGCTFTAG